MNVEGYREILHDDIADLSEYRGDTQLNDHEKLLRKAQLIAVDHPTQQTFFTLSCHNCSKLII